MKICVDDIPEAGLSLDLTVEGRELTEAAGGKLVFSFVNPVSAHLDFHKAKADVAVTGEINATVRLECSRCLKEFEHAMDIPFSDFFVRHGAEQREKELRPEDMEINFLEGPDIDTSEMILAQLALEDPMQPLCSPDCKGLCPVCGADLNKGPCGCEKAEKIDQRLAGIKDFKAGGQDKGPKG
ncbi:MAG: DUF177 domain-containing protein [Deltaproteobacteria bacterium]|nr:DUF177 domain-containing protein [Deltaproteobacteria bacterium]